MKKTFAFLIGCSFIFTAFTFISKPKVEHISKNLKKPNIIFILTDDQRWDALGFSGNALIKTPNMDKLASEGLYFKNAFVTTPICAASRATILTGLYERTHDFNFGKPNVNDNYLLESYPYLLKKAGYKTGLVGKFGIKVNAGLEDTMFNTMAKTAWPYFKMVNGKETHLVDIEGDKAIDFIKENKDSPFCLSFSTWSPHADDGTKEQYFWPKYTDSLYINDEIPTSETANPAFFSSLPDFLKNTTNRERWLWRFDTPDKYQKMVKGYYRMISGVDSVLGRIRKTLEEQGLADNTIIIFMGDNGYFLGERGFAGKWLMHEQSLRVPMIIYDPRQEESAQGKVFEQMVLNIDIPSTILKFANVTIPKSYQGQTLTTFYNGAPKNWRTSIFCEHRREGVPELPKTECYRDESWKFIRYENHPEFIELYNLKADFNETKNLAYDKTYAKKIAQYIKKCDSAASYLLSKRIQKK